MQKQLSTIEQKLLKCLQVQGKISILIHGDYTIEQDVEEFWVVKGIPHTTISFTDPAEAVRYVLYEVNGQVIRYG